MHPTFAESLDLDIHESPVQQAPGNALKPGMPALCQTVAAKLLRGDPEFGRYADAKPTRDGLIDFLSPDSQLAHDPRKVFKRLRWGGLCLVASHQRREIDELAQRYLRHGFAID